MTRPRSGPERPDRRAALGLAGALALGGCTGRALTGEDVPERAGETVTVDGVALHVERRGDGPPLVLVHGASGNLRDWTLGAAQAMSRSHTVFAFDRPGHGLSGWPEAGGERLSVQAALMRRALAQMGIARSTVVGHSYGGSVALAWAVEAPESVTGLMLLASPSQVWPGGLGLSTELLANPVLGPVIARAAPVVVTDDLARRVAGRVFAPQEPPPGYFPHLEPALVLSPASLRHNARQLAALKDEIRALVPRYPGLPMPVEVLHGTADDTVPLHIHSGPFAEQVPRARLTRLDGIGHMPHHVALPAVLAALERLGLRAAGRDPI